MKDVRSQGGSPVRIFCGQGGFFRCEVRTFWRKELRSFWNLWCVHTDKGEGVNYF